jgi:hypothetical protein
VENLSKSRIRIDPFSISHFSFVISEEKRFQVAASLESSRRLRTRNLPLVQAMTNEK